MTASLVTPRLPQELLDAIVDAFRTDCSMLKVLAITSHHFTHRAQEHIHRTVRAISRLDVRAAMEKYSSRLGNFVRVLVVDQQLLPPDRKLFSATSNYRRAMRAAEEQVTFSCAEDVYRFVQCFSRLEVLDLRCRIRVAPLEQEDACYSSSSSTRTPTCATTDLDTAMKPLRLRALRLRVIISDQDIRNPKVNDTEAETLFYDSILRVVDLGAIEVLSLRSYQTTGMNTLLKYCGPRLKHFMLGCDLPRGYTGPIGARDLTYNTALRTVYAEITCGCTHSLSSSHTIDSQLSVLARGLSTLSIDTTAKLRKVHLTIVFTNLQPELHVPEAALRALIESISRQAGQLRGPDDRSKSSRTIAVIITLHIMTGIYPLCGQHAQSHRMFEAAWWRLRRRYLQATYAHSEVQLQLEARPQYRRTDRHQVMPDTFQLLAGI